MAWVNYPYQSNQSIYGYSRDSASHHNIVPDTTIPVHANLSQELVRFFPNKLIVPVLGQSSSLPGIILINLFSGNHDILLKTNHSIRFKEFYQRTKSHVLLKDPRARETFLKGE